jgi:glutamate carboxypeptidase
MNMLILKAAIVVPVYRIRVMPNRPLSAMRTHGMTIKNLSHHQAAAMSATTSNPFDTDTILDGIRRWVEIETPTEAAEQVNRLATLVADGYRGLPATVERIAGRDGCGDHLVARSSWGQDAPGILVLSHIDTVHPLGFIERLPFKIDGDSAFGPGIYDMKGGAYLAYYAFRQLCAAGEKSPLGITQLFVSDEEIGSLTSRELIEAEGRKAKYVLVTEPARDGGKIVTGRKGVARFDVSIRGVPAHAGARPEDGRSAIRELANVIHALEALNDPKRGITVNVGVVRGGTRPNVIAEEAHAEVDARLPKLADADEVIAKILNLKSQSEGVTVDIRGELNRPPYEKSNAGAALFEHAKTLAEEIGFELVDTYTGGGSDGNFTAPFTATLDGLGVDGKGAHTHYEQLYISSIEPRARLLHRLYQTLR